MGGVTRGDVNAWRDAFVWALSGEPAMQRASA
jgi:hypothetical protein